MSKKVKINKICLELGDRVIELSLEQAQELRHLLNETFGSQVVVKPTIIEVERPIWRYPYITWHSDKTNDTSEWKVTSVSNNTLSLNAVNS